LQDTGLTYNIAFVRAIWPDNFIARGRVGAFCMNETIQDSKPDKRISFGAHTLPDSLDLKQ
jgi:hypothetical protein